MKFPPSLFLTSLWLHAFIWSRNVAIRYGTENYNKRKAENSTSSLLGRKEVQCLRSQGVHRSIWGAGCCPLLWKIREPCSNPSNARKKVGTLKHRDGVSKLSHWYVPGSICCCSAVVSQLLVFNWALTSAAWRWCSPALQLYPDSSSGVVSELQLLLQSYRL